MKYCKQLNQINVSRQTKEGVQHKSKYKEHLMSIPNIQYITNKVTCFYRDLKEPVNNLETF